MIGYPIWLSSEYFNERSTPKRKCDRCATGMYIHAPTRATLWGEDYCMECEPKIRQSLEPMP